MADGDIGDPGGSGFQLPDSPGDFTETAPPPSTPGSEQPEKPSNPFVPLTPGQEIVERTRLHYQMGRLNTISGAGRAMSLKALADVPPDAESSFMPGGFQDVARDELERIRLNQLAYNTAPEATTLGELAPAVTAHIAAGLLTPETFLNPFFKVGGVAWQAAHPFLARMFGYQLGQAAVQAVADPVTQAMQIKAGVSTAYDWRQTAWSIPLGAAWGTLGAFARDGTHIRPGKGPPIAPDINLPGITPEMTPYVPPRPETQVRDPFRPNAETQTVDVEQALGQAPSGVLPPPQQGMTRLYRDTGPNDDKAPSFFFAREPFGNASEYIDVPTEMAVGGTNGDRVVLPAQIAQQRQPLPKPETPAVPEAPSVFTNLTDYNKIVRGAKGEEPQTFTEWMRSQGGLKPDPELDSIFGRKKIDLIRKNGKSLDQIREAGVQQGWLHEDASINDVLDKLAAEDKGVKQFHPSDEARAQTAAARQDPKMIQTMAEVDTAMRDMGEHPDQITGKRKAEQKDIRNRAIEIAYTERDAAGDPIHPEIAVERAMTEYGEHAAAAEGQPRLVKGQPDVLADTGATPREGGGAGEAAPGLRGAGAEPPVSGASLAASSAEREVSARLKAMRGKGLAGRPGQRSEAGIASANVHAPLPPLENVQDMMSRISHLLDMPVRKGVTEKGAAAQYDFVSGIASIREVGPKAVQEWGHEIGHYVEAHVGEPLTKFINANEQSIIAIGGDALKPEWEAAVKRREGFGEFISSYITNRPILNTVDPDFTRRFVELMQKEDPGLLRILNSAADSYETFKNSSSTRAMVSMIKSNTAVPLPPTNDPLKLGPFERMTQAAYRNVIDGKSPMDDWVRAVARAHRELHEGKLLDLPPNEDPRAWLKIFGRGGAGKTKADAEYGLIWNLNTFERDQNAKSWRQIMERVVTSDGTTKPESAAILVARRDHFAAYLVARWQKQLVQQMERGEREMSTRMPTAAPMGDVLRTIEEAEALYPHWIPEAQNVYALQKDVVKLEHNSGLKGRDAYNDQVENPANWEYVSLLRDTKGMTERLHAQGTFGSKGLEVLNRYARKGSDLNIMDPMETLLMHMAHVNDQALENMTVRGMRDIIRSFPDRRYARIIGEEIPNEKLRAIDIDLHDTVYRAAKKEGFTTEDARMYADRVVREVGHEDMRVKIFRSEGITPDGRPILFGWDNGERFAIRLPGEGYGPLLANTMDMIGPRGAQLAMQSSSLLMDVLATPATALRVGATGTLTYALKNIVRDSGGAYFLVPEVGNVKGFPLFFRNIIRGASSIARKDEFYQWYIGTEGIGGGVATAGLKRGAGGLTELERGMKIGGHSIYEQQKARIAEAKAITAGSKEDIAARAFAEFPKWYDFQERNRLTRELEQLGIEKHKGFVADSFRSLVQIMEKSEMAGRIGIMRAVYDSNIEMGRTHAWAMFDAAQKARDFTDYNRFGSRMEGAARLIPFMNANIQGINKFIRTNRDALYLTETLTQQHLENKQMARNQLLPRLGLFAAASVGLQLYNRDDPVYQQMSVQTRSNYWVMRLPFIGQGTYFTPDGVEVKLPQGLQGAWFFIAKPFEAGSIFNFAERMTEFLLTNDTTELKKLWESMGYTFQVPSGLNSLGDALAAIKANYDPYYDMPIIPKRMEGIAPHMQSDQYTGKFYKMIAEAINLLPGGSSSVKKFLDAIPYVGATLGSFTSPMEAQYLMQRAFGDVPRELGGVEGTLNALATGSPVDLQDAPGLRAFYRDKMAMGQPMQELFNQVGQNEGRLEGALKSWRFKTGNGDNIAAQAYFRTLDKDEQDYIKIKEAQAGPLATLVHPLDRAMALARVVGNIRQGLQSDNGMATLIDPNVRINLEAGKKQVVIQTLNEFAAIEARNSHIVQGVPGYKHLPIIDTGPMLDYLKVLSPDISRELSARLAKAKVMPIETIQEYWPKMQKLLAVGPGASAVGYIGELKSLSFQAASKGYEGGGMKAGRRAIDESGRLVKPGKKGPSPIPYEGAVQ